MGSFVLVHGMAHGAWCWDRTVADLRARGHQVAAVDLPLTSLDDDAAVVRETLDASGEPVVLVGHSYGGLVISKAADRHPRVARLVYVAALMLDADDVLANHVGRFPSSPLNAHSSIGEDLTVAIDPFGGAAYFYNECDPLVAAAAAARLRPTALACMASPAGAEPWRSTPSTYVLCRRDMAVHPEMQRWMSERATDVVELDTDHSPFLSMSDEFADLLDGIAPVGRR